MDAAQTLRLCNDTARHLSLVLHMKCHFKNQSSLLPNINLRMELILLVQMPISNS